MIGRLWEGAYRRFLLLLLMRLLEKWQSSCSCWHTTPMCLCVNYKIWCRTFGTAPCRIFGILLLERLLFTAENG